MSQYLIAAKKLHAGCDRLRNACFDASFRGVFAANTVVSSQHQYSVGTLD